MAQSGAVWTANNVAGQLYEQNRDYNNRKTWQSLFSQNANTAMQAENQLVQDYSKATTQAYTSYLQNKNAIENSAYVGSGKQALLSDNEQILQDAYNSYRNSLSEGQSAISEALTEGDTAISEALQQQAQYTADYANAHWDYLEQLYYDYTQGENTVFDSKLWSKYVTNTAVLDENGNPMYDEKGEPITEARIMTRDELASQLYDANGNLTLQGVDFYDQIENAIAQSGKGMSWGDYLASNNEDLFNWATSYNPYNYTFEGTNAGTFRTMVGMAADDNQWAFAERYGGLNEEEIKAMYEPFQQHLEELNSIDLAANPDKFVNGVKDINTDLWNMAEELGLDGQMEELGISKQMTEQWLTDVGNGVVSENDLSWQMLADIGVHAGGVAAAGGFVGGPVWALIGGVAGMIGGAVVAKERQKETQAQNKEIGEQFKAEYTKMLNDVINQSLQRKRQIDIDFANKNT